MQSRHACGTHACMRIFTFPHFLANHIQLPNQLVSSALSLDPPLVFPRLQRPQRGARGERGDCCERSLIQVLEEEGEEAYFAAFEGQDADDYRSLDEDGFVDAIAALSPGMCFRLIVHDKNRMEFLQSSGGPMSPLCSESSCQFLLVCEYHVITRLGRIRSL